MSANTVFISYSHDSDEHRETVLVLSERLRAIWPARMLDRLDAAQSISLLFAARVEVL